MEEDLNEEIEESLTAQRLAEAQAIISMQRSQIERLEKLVSELRCEVQDLRARLGQDSTNSSKPPSSDPPWKPPAERRQKGRRRGGQPGHRGHKRELVDPQEVVPVKPTTCAHCGLGLCGDDPEPWRHQVTEVEPVLARVTEYQLHSLACGECGKRTTAELPAGVPHGMFGPRLQMILALCSGAYRLSKRNIVAIMDDFFGVKVSVGTISNMEQSTSEMLQAPYAEALSRMKKGRYAHVDETGWYQRARRAWMWVAVTASVTVFMIRMRRNAAVARELLAKFGGILVSDMYSGYSFFSAARRQICWAHLIRAFRNLLEYDPVTKAFGERLGGFTERLFDEWHKVPTRDVAARRLFEAACKPLREEFHQLLQEGAGSSSARVRRTCKTLSKYDASLWTFAREHAIEPTNNAAERALRHAVVWRKTSYGTDSEAGSRFVERILTVVATLRMQRRNVLAYLTELCRAAHTRQPTPALCAGG